MKSPTRKAGAAPKRPKQPRTTILFNTTVKEGDLITFDPTGEQVRVTKIEDGRITFEKRP